MDFDYLRRQQNLDSGKAIFDLVSAACLKNKTQGLTPQEIQMIEIISDTLIVFANREFKPNTPPHIRCDFILRNRIKINPYFENMVNPQQAQQAFSKEELVQITTAKTPAEQYRIMKMLAKAKGIVMDPWLLSTLVIGFLTYGLYQYFGSTISGMFSVTGWVQSIWSLWTFAKTWNWLWWYFVLPLSLFSRLYGILK